MVLTIMYFMDVMYFFVLLYATMNRKVKAPGTVDNRGKHWSLGKYLSEKQETQLPLPCLPQHYPYWRPIYVLFRALFSPPPILALP